MAIDFQFETLAEDALLLRFGERIDIRVNAEVTAAAACLQRALPQLECVPAYASLLLRFDPMAWAGESVDPHQHLRDAVQEALLTPMLNHAATQEHLIPVCYGGTCGPDLENVAKYVGLAPDIVISRHVAADYRVGMIGFAPGFPYLLGLDPTLAVPRHSDPRQRVPAGSVAIGGEQTGVYPRELPGGWQLIGRTPLRLFDLSAASPSLLAAGDRVRFSVIDDEAFARLQAEQTR
jgi:KipI family sensor histidine kinase inhibitor